MSEEDKLVNSLIRYHRELDAVGPDVKYSQKKFTPEAHYNHYGNRGVADLHVRKTLKKGNMTSLQDSLYEIKGASAISNSTGANQIIRQFNRMRNFFYKDESLAHPDRVHCELTFTLEPECVEHIIENYEMYQSVHQTDEISTQTIDASAQLVLFREPGVDEPAHIDFGSVSLADPEEYLNRVEKMSTQPHAKIGTILKDILD